MGRISATGESVRYQATLSRRDFDIEYISRQLSTLDAQLKAPLTVYVAGGFVMAARGLKVGTKDIDVIVEDKPQLDYLMKGLQGLDYRIIAKPVMEKVYRKMAAQAVLENKDGFRWDVFLRVVANKLFLSDAMRKRAKTYFTGKRLAILTLSGEDIFLMKGVTERDRDLDDMFLIARAGIDYDVVYRECLSQSEETERIWESGLYDNCKQLGEKYNLQVPFLTPLRKKAERRIFLRIIGREVRAGRKSQESITTALSRGGLTSKDIRDVLKDLSEEGEIRVQNGIVSIQAKRKKH